MLASQPEDGISFVFFADKIKQRVKRHYRCHLYSTDDCHTILNLLYDVYTYRFVY